MPTRPVFRFKMQEPVAEHWLLAVEFEVGCMPMGTLVEINCGGRRGFKSVPASRMALMMCRLGVLIEVNCETDFVARGAKFKELVQDMAMQAAASPSAIVVALQDVPEAEIEKERAIEMGKEDIQSKPEAIRLVLPQTFALCAVNSVGMVTGVPTLLSIALLGLCLLH